MPGRAGPRLPQPRPSRSKQSRQPLCPSLCPGEALRDLLARLSDAEVRELLIAQLDKEIGTAPAPDVDGYIDELKAEAATLRENDDLPDIRQTKACDSTIAIGSCLSWLVA